MPENDAPISRAKAIRDFLAEHPDASPTSAAEALTAQGIPVAPAFVSAVKSVLESPRQPVPDPEMPPMHLPFGEGKLFYKLYAAMCSYANGKPMVWMVSAMRYWCDKLKLGKGSGFVKRDLRLLPLTDAEYEADFWFDAASSTKRRELWMGMVIVRELDSLRTIRDVAWPPPTVNDLANFLANAMSRPLSGGDRQRPRAIHLRDRPQWQELLPHLQQLGIEVVLADELPWLDRAVVEFLQHRASQQVPPKAVDEEKIREDLKRPFPAPATTGSDNGEATGHRTAGPRMGASGLLVVRSRGGSPCPQAGNDACGQDRPVTGRGCGIRGAAVEQVAKEPA